MPRIKQGLKAVLTSIEHNPDRSTLFWWLVEHHDEVSAKANGSSGRGFVKPFSSSG